MRPVLRRLPAILAPLLLFGCSASGTFGQPAGSGQVEDPKVALVVIDGLRYADGLGHPDRTLVPEMNAIAGRGAVVEPFTNDGVTLTAMAVPAIWCGAWTQLQTFWDEDCGGETTRTALPTIWEYLRRQQDLPASDAVYFLPDYPCPWRASVHPDYGPEFWPRYVTRGSGDQGVWEAARPVLDADAPRLFLLYLPDVDHAGHVGDWTGYEESISTADRVVGELWDYLQGDPDYAGQTTLLVTNDHGRHTDDFTGHGDGCEGCRTVQLLAAGPGIREAHVSTTPHRIVDVAPTIGRILGFQTEHATGRVMEDLFVQ